MSDEIYNAAQRIVDEDGAIGVAILMADHRRLLLTLRKIYDATAVSRRAAVIGVASSSRLIRIRSMAHDGLKMPEDRELLLSAVGKLAATDTEFDVKAVLLLLGCAGQAEGEQAMQEQKRRRELLQGMVKTEIRSWSERPRGNYRDGRLSALNSILAALQEDDRG